MALDPDLLELLACPRCKGPLVYDADAPSLTCDGCGLRYRIDEGIPVLLVEEAEAV